MKWDGRIYYPPPPSPKREREVDHRLLFEMLLLGTAAGFVLGLMVVEATPDKAVALAAFSPLISYVIGWGLSKGEIQ